MLKSPVTNTCRPEGVLSVQNSCPINLYKQCRYMAVSWLYQPLEIVTYIFVGSHKQTYLSLDLIIENQGGLLFCIISKKLIKH